MVSASRSCGGYVNWQTQHSARARAARHRYRLSYRPSPSEYVEVIRCVTSPTVTLYVTPPLSPFIRHESLTVTPAGAVLDGRPAPPPPDSGGGGAGQVSQTARGAGGRPDTYVWAVPSGPRPGQPASIYFTLRRCQTSRRSSDGL